MDYNKLSDSEINYGVATATALDEILANGEVGEFSVDECIDMHELEKDYCNNPADAWPIIVENKICLNAYENDEGWFATTDTSFFVDDENPLRAAMIVFLMMKENK